MLRISTRYGILKNLFYCIHIPRVFAMGFGMLILDTVERYEYILDLCKDSSNRPFDYGLVAVLDGERLKLTPLRISNVPPPMSASELSIASPASHVSFESIGQNFAVLRQRAVDVATWTDFNSIRVANPKIVHTFKYISLPPLPESFLQLLV